MGSKTIQTPRIDELARTGLVYSGKQDLQFAHPTGCFLTGKHSGHTSVRVNGGGTPLRSESHDWNHPEEEDTTGGLGNGGVVVAAPQEFLSSMVLTCLLVIMIRFMPTVIILPISSKIVRS